MNFLRGLVLIVLCCSSAAAQDKKLTQEQIDKAQEEGMKKLQGLWLFEKAENNGAGAWSLSEETLLFENNILHQIKKDGKNFAGSMAEFTIDATKTPMTIDIDRKVGGREKIKGIYKFENDTLVIATNTKDETKRPEKFSVKLTDGPARATNLQTFKFMKPDVVERPAKKKLTDAEIEAANAAALKSLQGLWIFEKGERNLFGGWAMSEEAIYIEKNILRRVSKNGEFPGGSGEPVELAIDATTPYLTVDLIPKTGGSRTKYSAIYKIEGDRLIVAWNGEDKPRRPAQFSVKLSAGLERASFMHTYKLVKPDVVERPAPKDKLTQDQIDAANAAALKSLQGLWISEKSEQNGGGSSNVHGEAIYIEKDLWRSVTKQGEFRGGGDRRKITIDATKPHVAIDFIRGRETVHGIFKIEGERLTIATNTSGDIADIRPGQFTVKLTAGLERASNLQTYKRVKADVVEKPAPKKEKLTQEQIDAANAAALKSLQGIWTFEKAEQNGGGSSNLHHESIYIEKDLLRTVNKKGEFIAGGDSRKIKIDATKPHAAIDFVRGSETILGIFKIEGERLIIATNTSGDIADIRPGQFTVKLTAGLERASNLHFYKRVKPERNEKPAPKKEELTQDQIDAANAAALKSLQGLWMFEKAEQNGGGSWALGHDPIYIEKDLLRTVNKKGEFIAGGDSRKIKVNAAKPYATIDLIRSETVLGIFKIEGDRLIIATNTSGDIADIRPTQFSVKLTAGLERASNIHTYKRLKPEKVEKPAPR